MELNEYLSKAMTTCQETSDNWSYMFGGIVEELGELSGKVTKPIRKGLMIVYDNQLHFTESATVDDRVDIMDAIEKELGDMYWMLAGLTRVLGLDAETVARKNLEKLQDRKKRGVIIGEGDNR